MSRSTVCLPKEKSNLKNFAAYVSLNVLGLVAFNSYILADTLFISTGIGLNALTALNLALPIFGMMYGFGMMLGMGGATRFSVLKAQGADNSKVFAHCLVLGLVLSLIFILLGAFASHEISMLFGATDAVLALTQEYLRVAMLFAPAFIINHICVCFVRNDSNPVLAMIAVATGSIANIILDYVFIFPLNMGMFGAILATGLSPCISLCVLSIHWIFKKSSVHIRITKPDFRLLLSVLRVGIFSFVSEVSSGISILVFNIIIMKISGEIGVAAYGILANIFIVAIGFFNGVAQGMQPLVSRAYGEGSQRDMRQLLSYGIITALVLAAITYTLVAVFAPEIVGVFNSENNAQLVKLAVIGCRIYFVALIFASFNIVASGFFGATERGSFAFLITILRGFAVLVPLAFLLANTLGMIGVWLSFPITEIIVCIVAMALLIILFKRVLRDSVQIKADKQLIQ